MHADGQCVTKPYDFMNNQTIIIAGIDFTDSSPIVLRHALYAAEACGGKVVAFHILDKSLRENRDTSGLGNPGYETLKAQAEGRFADLLKDNAPGVEAQFVVKIGKPAEEIANLAVELGASFLVISANDMTKKRLGTIAARCLRMVPCDVLVLRDWQGGAFGNIVVCTDFSETAGRALTRAASLAKQSGANLEIVNVMYPPSLDSWGEVLQHADDSATSYEDECKAAVKAQMDRFLERGAAALEGVRHEALILESSMPAVAITAHVQVMGADLVVMGTQGHSPFMSHFIGTNAERLIQEASVSVFAVR